MDKNSDAYDFLYDWRYGIIEACEFKEEVQQFVRFVMLAGLDNAAFLDLATKRLKEVPSIGV